MTVTLRGEGGGGNGLVIKEFFLLPTAIKLEGGGYFINSTAIQKNVSFFKIFCVFPYRGEQI